MKKRVLSTVLAFTLGAVAFTGCGSTEKSSSVDSASSSKEAATSSSKEASTSSSEAASDSGDEDKVVAKINELTKKAIDEGSKVGIIATSETADRYSEGQILVIGDRSDEGSIAHNLYDILRKFDELGVDLIYSESFATPNMGQAIMNRLLKAAGQKTLDV